MAIINRLTTWTIGQILKAADLNGEFNNITNLFNNLDAATSTWTNVKTTTLTPTNVGAFTATGAIAMGSNKITGLANGTAATDAQAYGQNQYLQAAVQVLLTGGATTTTSNVYQSAGLAASITPSTSSTRIKITSTGVIKTANAVNSDAILTVKRGSTDIAPSTNGLAFADIAGWTPYCITYIDSPATTSSTTYTVFLRNDDNATTISWGIANFTSVIILEELR